MLYILYLTLLPPGSGLSYVDGGRRISSSLLESEAFPFVVCLYDSYLVGPDVHQPLLDADYLWARVVCLQKISSYKNESSSIPFHLHFILFIAKLSSSWQFHLKLS